MITRSEFNADPIRQFKKWYKAAEESGMKQPEAMTLATASKSKVPSARIVLFKGLNPEGFTFFTNYLSKKAKELDSNPKAAIVFYWPWLDKQIRIEGKVKKVTAQESDEYWGTRPRESQIGALASNQSSVIDGWTSLKKRVAELETQYCGKPIPRPIHWGGYCLIPNKIEFWSLGQYRLHDRYCYTKTGKKWNLKQLSP